MKLIFGLLLFSTHCFAAEIAYIEMYNRNGHLIQLEPNGRYAHMAISYQGKWLHADPKRGVELVDKATLALMGRVKIVHYPSLSEPTDVQVGARLGQPYDPTFSWQRKESNYCAKLIAEILNIEPQPMSFTAPVWSRSFRARAGELGISPDDIYEILRPLSQSGASACAASAVP